jgi:hypothetical protein
MKKVLLLLFLKMTLFGDVCYLGKIKNNDTYYNMQYICVDGQKFLMIKQYKKMGLAYLNKDCKCPKK